MRKWNKIPTPWTPIEIIVTVLMFCVVVYITYDIISNIPWR